TRALRTRPDRRRWPPAWRRDPASRAGGRHRGPWRRPCRRPGTTGCRGGPPPTSREATAPGGAPRPSSPWSGEASAQEAALTRLELEAIAKVWMRDRDQRLGALGHRFSLQVYDAVLRHHVHDVRARGGDDVARGERAHDPALALARALPGGREAHERLAAA